MRRSKPMSCQRSSLDRGRAAGRAEAARRGTDAADHWCSLVGAGGRGAGQDTRSEHREALDEVQDQVRQPRTGLRPWPRSALAGC
jgi:hypothetical protein